MGKLFVNQSKLQWKVNTKADLAAVTEVKLKFKKPDDSVIERIATVLDADTGLVEYDTQVGDLDQAGKWVVWAFLTFSDGKTAPCEASYFTIHEEGVVT